MDPYELQFTPADVAKTLAEWRERKKEPVFAHWYGSIIGHELLSTADHFFGLEGICLEDGQRKYAVTYPRQLEHIQATFNAGQQYTTAAKAAIFPENDEISVDEQAVDYHAALRAITIPITQPLLDIGPLNEHTERLCREVDISVRKLIYAANRFFNHRTQHNSHYLKEDILSFIERMFDIIEEKNVKIGCIEVRPVLTAAPYFDEAIAPLIWNAIDHARIDGTKLWISIEAKPEYHEGSAYDVRAPGTCTVKVQDSGQGMPYATLERIFEHGFTTKKNTTFAHGLGLYGVKQFVEHQGGAISVVSEPGKGTMFTITIPYQRAELNLCIQE